MTVSDSILGGALSPAAAGGIPEALLEEAVYEAHRLAATIGKAGMDKWVYEDVFARTGTVFLTTVGCGIAALYGRAVKRVIDVHWKEELGLPEAMWVLEVENFGPFIVDGDCTGASLAALAIDKINPNFAREYAKLPDYVLKRIGEIDHSNPTTTTPILPQPCQSTGVLPIRGGLAGPFLAGAAMKRFGPPDFPASLFAVAAPYTLFAAWRQATRGRRTGGNACDGAADCIRDR